jgi:hypothetical protein
LVVTDFEKMSLIFIVSFSHLFHKDTVSQFDSMRQQLRGLGAKRLSFEEVKIGGV